MIRVQPYVEECELLVFGSRGNKEGIDSNDVFGSPSFKERTNSNE
jgi:hypothetical protein